MRRGIATFTLDYGKCPPWLFERMVKLGREMTRVLIEEYGPDEFIKRIADPVWFQSLGTVLAFDWNASGLTTILTASLKEAIRGQERYFGIFICGGKGKTSRKTPDEIMEWGVKLSLPVPIANNLVYNSRMSAKVDSSLIQDGFQIYHHSFFFSKNGAWTVVQQGMNTQNQTARRYHWFSEDIDDLIVEPHSGITSQSFHSQVLNLTSKKSNKTRKISTELVSDGFETLKRDIEIIRRHASDLSQVISLAYTSEVSPKVSPSSHLGGEKRDTLTLANFEGVEFHHHPVENEDFWNSPYLKKILAKLADQKPKTYEQLLATQGVGPKTVRALSLVSEVIYGAKPSYEDPARYSFAHGGKDATPYPVDRLTYDQTIETLRHVVAKSKINRLEKDRALKRLAG
ncbi:DUF763 domain-containing protein [Candidatus Daviesbacteria bacterium]|nr:DUF763 domain-containing protein [Candidatus Daviesbacteria bacterium]